MSWILSSAVGQRGTHDFPVMGKLPKKVVPSGGSRHPSDTYLIILNVEGIENGTYFYSSQSHALLKIDRLDYREFIKDSEARFTMILGTSPAVIFFIATTFDRSWYRYRESRSYRVVHHDIGHITQNFTYVVRSLKRRLAADYTPSEAKIEPLLGLDGLSSALMTSLAIA